MSEWDKCMSYSSSSTLVFQKSLASLNLGFRTFYLLRDNYLLYFISFFLFFLSSIDIVLMLAHVFSAFVELGYVNHF